MRQMADPGRQPALRKAFFQHARKIAGNFRSSSVPKDEVAGIARLFRSGS
jgi:hypothetical protein